jgi:hypothetical protein
MSWGVLDLFQIADGLILALKNFCSVLNYGSTRRIYDAFAIYSVTCSFGISLCHN